METEPITTETAKVQLLPTLRVKKSKTDAPMLLISTTIAIPAFRTIEVLLPSKIKLAKNELCFFVPMPELGCGIIPGMLAPGAEIKELKLTFFNASNGTVRLEASKPIAYIVSGTFTQSKEKKEE